MRKSAVLGLASDKVPLESQVCCEHPIEVPGKWWHCTSPGSTWISLEPPLSVHMLLCFALSHRVLSDQLVCVSAFRAPASAACCCRRRISCETFHSNCFFKKNFFYCYSITVVCLFSPSLATAFYSGRNNCQLGYELNSRTLRLHRNRADAVILFGWHRTYLLIQAHDLFQLLLFFPKYFIMGISKYP